jgi:hypothetical protein
MTNPLSFGSGEAEEWLADWTASISARAEAARELSDRVAVLSASASGADGAVTVTVSGSGVVTDLRLTDRVQRWSPTEIAEEILTVMRRAQGLLAGKVADAARQTVGTDTETGRAVIASFERRFPEQPPDDGGPERRRRDQHGG